MEQFRWRARKQQFEEKIGPEREREKLQRELQAVWDG